VSRGPRHVSLNALFLDPDRSAGPETYLRGLVPALAREFPQTRLSVVTTRRGADRLKQDGWTDFCTLVRMPADEGERGRRLAAEQVLYPAHGRRRGADLLHSLASVAPVRPGMRSVITLHDATFFEHKTFGTLTTAAMRAIVSTAAPRAEALITGSAAARDQITRVLGIPAERMTVVHHGAGRSWGNATAAPEDEVRARHDLEGRRVVLCVGSIRPHKNQGLLVRALAHLPQDVTLVLAGAREPYADELEQVARELGVEDRVRTTGYVGDGELEGLWKLAAAAAFPTLAEGFGLPVIEAMDRGVPVACSDIDVLREVGGDVPRYFDPHDPAAAAAAIEAAITEPQDGRAQAARFTWEACAQGTHEVYERACTSA
jgi:glycosyltransferase involved in cell wall biosynthesis